MEFFAQHLLQAWVYSKLIARTIAALQAYQPALGPCPNAHVTALSPPAPPLGSLHEREYPDKDTKQSLLSISKCGSE